ncbi:MAG: phosphatidylserine decarboxylase family protein [Acidobacteria bacterium]|nr:phosphatidylserine decarboxylase family protein [Acidobacteriota bacterium]
MVADAFRFLVPVLILAAVFWYLGWDTPAVIALVLAGLIAFFFRNPRRSIPDGRNLIVSPADGRIVRIAGTDAPAEGKGDTQTVSIFLGLLDVHVNRSPIQGRLESADYRTGRFRAAFKQEASRVNEQNILTVQGDGIRVVVKQIAGLIARRIVCWKRPGDLLGRGELFGLIRFGSRVDLLLPANAKVLVRVGDRVRGGASVIGEWS